MEEVRNLGKMATMQLRSCSSFAEIPADHWDHCAGTDMPMLRHAYLHALEMSGSASPAQGWQPLPLLAEDGSGQLLGAIPLWLKGHSFGELVYDFAWAQAYASAGLHYYPKLIAALPFTPVSGRRILLAPDANAEMVLPLLLDGARRIADRHHASSLHWLFTDRHDTALLEQHGYLHRTGIQFHWENRGYRDFEDFLSGFSAERRKKLRRERRYVRDAGISTEIRTGRDVSMELWDRFYDFYTANILRHGGMIHLTREFFYRLGESMPDAIVLVLARRGIELVGAAFNLCSHDALFGRYWGGLPDVNSLHFETCYYTPIEYCIDRGLKRFEGGAGGEHKLARGFLPVTTHSLHWLRHVQFSDAVADFLAREQRGVSHYVDELNEHAPFKQGMNPKP